MAKKKFVEKRLKEARQDVRDGISARSKANEIVDTVRGLGAEVEAHNMVCRVQVLESGQ